MIYFLNTVFVSCFFVLANGCCDDSPSSGAGAALDTDSHNNDGCCDDLDCGDCSGGDCNCDCDC